MRDYQKRARGRANENGMVVAAATVAVAVVANGNHVYAIASLKRETVKRTENEKKN